MVPLKFRFMSKNFFQYENAFYKYSPFSRLEKLILQLEVFKKTSKTKGEIIEFGVFKGNSLIRLISFNKIYSKYKKKIYAFDVFGKFPIATNKKDISYRRNFIKNAGKNSVSSRELNYILKKKNFKNFHLIKGDVLKTIPLFLKKNKKLKFSFINLDLDLYEPSLLVLEKFYPKLSKNGIIVLDNFKQFYGETKAVREFVKIKGIKNKIFYLRK